MGGKQTRDTKEGKAGELCEKRKKNQYLKKRVGLQIKNKLVH